MVLVRGSVRFGSVDNEPVVQSSEQLNTTENGITLNGINSSPQNTTALQPSVFSPGIHRLLVRQIHRSLSSLCGTTSKVRIVLLNNKEFARLSAFLPPSALLTLCLSFFQWRLRLIRAAYPHTYVIPMISDQAYVGAQFTFCLVKEMTDLFYVLLTVHLTII